MQHEGVPQEVPRHEEALQGQVRRREEVRNITGRSKEEELHDTNEWFGKLGCKEIPKYVVVSARRHHHIRFFPMPERRPQQSSSWYLWLRPSCTHPFELDFYLCSRGYRTSDPLPVHPGRGCIHSLVFDFSLRSHVAIKGTARPIHHQCILNEGEWLVLELQHTALRRTPSKAHCRRR